MIEEFEEDADYYVLDPKDEKARIIEMLHETYQHADDEGFKNWVRTTPYGQVVYYQSLPQLQFLYNFAEKHGYLDRQKVILNEMIRTKEFLDKRKLETGKGDEEPEFIQSTLPIL